MTDANGPGHPRNLKNVLRSMGVLPRLPPCKLRTRRVSPSPKVQARVLFVLTPPAGLYRANLQAEERASFHGCAASVAPSASGEPAWGEPFTESASQDLALGWREASSVPSRVSPSLGLPFCRVGRAGQKGGQAGRKRGEGLDQRAADGPRGV